ncbi:MAG: hypothetical protein K5Q68_25410, partial [Roseococcus sp.]|nr:hypothetical protein [Roseococcus sp.]
RRICRLEARICQDCGYTDCGVHGLRAHGLQDRALGFAGAQEKRAILEASAARLAMREMQLDSA